MVKEVTKFSLLKIDLLTGKKNQIRVHLANEGHPVVGDSKYGRKTTKFKRLALHSYSICLTHPFSQKRMTFATKVPEFFSTIVGLFEVEPILLKG